MLGIRGVPARYGGLETCAEEVSIRLVERGHEVVVYCRKGTWDDNAQDYRGVRRITLPSLKTKYTDTYSHSLLCVFHVLKEKPDVIMAFNSGIGTLCIVPKIFGYRIALNPDGFDWRRGKWGRLAKAFIFASAWMSAHIVDQIIADAITIRDYFNNVLRCRRPAVFIGNGADADAPTVSESESREILQKYGVEKEKYVLFLSRHVPENSCGMFIEAFERLDADLKLLFGGSPVKGYTRSLKTTRDTRILFPGGIYDPKEVKVLHENSLLLLHGNQAGGMSLGLLKALGYGTCVITLNTPDNVAVAGDAAVFFELSIESIRDTIQGLVANPDELHAYREKARARITDEFSWDRVAQKYEDAFNALIEDVR